MVEQDRELKCDLMDQLQNVNFHLETEFPQLDCRMHYVA